MKAELDEHGLITLTPETPTEAYALKHRVMESWISPGDEMRMEIGHWRGSNLIVGEKKHTRGPWHLEYDNLIQDNSWLHITAENKQLVLQVANFDSVAFENLADIKLIAAAPELLEALEDAVEYLKPLLPDEILAPHLAVIKKARGEV